MSAGDGQGEQSGEGDVPRSGQERAAQIVVLGILTVALQVAVVAMIGSVYQEAAMDVLPEVQPHKRGTDFREWRASLLGGLFADFTISLWSCLFPCARWADTLQKAGIMSYWPALWLATGLMLVELTDGLCWVLFLAVLAFFRQRLRRVFKMESDSCSTYTTDALALCFCLPCVISQDAHQVEEACAAGDPAVVPHWAA